MELFRDRRYRHLFSAQVIALIGTGLTTVGLALLASELAGERAGEVLGTALAIKMIAYVGIAPVVGAYATRLPRRALLVTLDLLRAAVVVSLPFVTEVWQIYLLIFLLNACSAGFTPVFQATIPDIFEDERRYTRALSLSRLAYDLENLLSPLIAALLLVVMSFNLLFVLNAAAFLLSALLVVSVSLPSPHPQTTGGGVWSRLTQGMRRYLHTPRLRGLLALNMAVAAAGAMQIVNTVVYVRHALGMGEIHVAIAFAAAGGGSMVVALSLPRLLVRLDQRPVMLAGGLLMSASLVAGLTAPGFAVLLLLWFVLGAGASMVMTPTGRLLKQSCRAEERPALFAAQFSLSHACWLVAYPLAGWLGSTLGMMTAFAALATLALAATLLAARLWPAQVTEAHA
ncbi:MULTISPECIES: MFS transporter [unclassified Halomonas]|uniref:MFS transporter n=1 Tax=unclassified Halomonas TaxID=2609666 RepID=UPI000E5C0039|nr:MULTISPECIES: MFS transporter [unclassified Halomonas]AXY43844.1 MFS transporter [Halomonas sp. JS92-SW72]QJQ98370.1 MFS transporter [Halomonas sp. PGE1]